MNYVWHERKKKRPQHMVGEDGRTLCQLENIHRRRKSSRPHTVRSNTPAPDRSVCRNCIDIDAQNASREPDLAVLLGERMQ